MKSIMIALAALALPAAAATAVMPDGLPTGDGPGGMVNQMNPDGFKNRGQCEAALARETNRQRQNPDQRVGSRQDESTSEFQKNIQARFACEYFEDFGAYYVVVV